VPEHVAGLSVLSVLSNAIARVSRSNWTENPNRHNNAHKYMTPKHVIWTCVFINFTALVLNFMRRVHEEIVQNSKREVQ